ncbi:PREDICTED: probable ubiquitin-conjugating enzyme E2 24 [Nicotiana attenuata]|uniref:Ubiquitin-conjugating enzyme e2 24 n=1 Tax=Nicotiana attenuata TaxID=49451 RepID=A0A314L0M6_NICAT|nr:PREDICTED: probable ubiquitin-conjugating enzyme E2 24 [Nicotiana attenuata]OIT35201.1 putative ubiquitin-conjugating enzyme e2 24 [Nicotiana attenuata]
MDKANKSYGEIEEILDDVEQRFKQIKKFDLLPHPPYDHHFLTYDRNFKNMVSGSTFHQRIENEWFSLENKLPSSVLVRSYEKRIDLMRAVLVGPPDTPYAHGLFFFDILFPRNYPNCPPRIHYHSYDLDLNPYLDPKGKVSLSLLEYGISVSNWYCGVQDKWNPPKSDILQVLTAIQTSVLSANLLNPGGREGLRESNNLEWLKYKKALTLTCKGMLYMLREPPLNFQDFVEGYFRTRGHYILLNYKKQMDGSDFMHKLFLDLYRAFEQNGTYCKHHLSEVLQGAHLPEKEKTNKKGFVKNVATILSDFLN